MAATERAIGANENSFIPVLTPKHKPWIVPSGLEPAETMTNVNHGTHSASYAQQVNSRRQKPCLSISNVQRPGRHTVTAFEKATTRQPTTSILGRSKLKDIPRGSTSGNDTLRLQSASSENINNRSSSKKLTSSSIASLQSNGAITQGRSRSQNVLKESLSKEARASSHQATDGKRPKVSAVSQRDTSQRSTRTTSAFSVPGQEFSDNSEDDYNGHRHLQRELLQLHILHSLSADTHSQWREKAKAHFRSRFQALVDRHMEIADIIFQTQELKNRAALVEWCRNSEAAEISKRVRILSGCIRDLCENLDPGGKYSQTVESFAEWHNRAQDIRKSRQDDSANDTAIPTYVEEIGAGWQNDVNILQRSLSTLTGELRTLGSANPNSTLGQLLVVLRDLVLDMLTELDCIRSIECELVSHEKVWVEEQITRLSRKAHRETGGPRDTPSNI
ncbi:MAG: hypothetical protein Q9186_006786 [Xanthomendoza sp. 1 TL-2023]